MFISNDNSIWVHTGNLFPLIEISGKKHEKFVFERCYLDNGDDGDDDYVDGDDDDDGPRMACASDAIWRDTG